MAQRVRVLLASEGPANSFIPARCFLKHVSFVSPIETDCLINLFVFIGII